MKAHIERNLFEIKLHGTFMKSDKPNKEFFV